MDSTVYLIFIHTYFFRSGVILYCFCCHHTQKLRIYWVNYEFLVKVKIKTFVMNAIQYQFHNHMEYYI